MGLTVCLTLSPPVDPPSILVSISVKHATSLTNPANSIVSIYLSNSFLLFYIYSFILIAFSISYSKASSKSSICFSINPILFVLHTNIYFICFYSFSIPLFYYFLSFITLPNDNFLFFTYYTSNIPLFYPIGFY